MALENGLHPVVSVRSILFLLTPAIAILPCLAWGAGSCQRCLEVHARTELSRRYLRRFPRGRAGVQRRKPLGTDAQAARDRLLPEHDRIHDDRRVLLLRAQPVLLRLPVRVPAGVAQRRNERHARPRVAHRCGCGDSRQHPGHRHRHNDETQGGDALVRGLDDQCNPILRGRRQLRDRWQLGYAGASPLWLLRHQGVRHYRLRCRVPVLHRDIPDRGPDHGHRDQHRRRAYRRHGGAARLRVSVFSDR
mmetsp:Transcript_48672/g.136076  ORF Transcript_48672/g.136076 Transcript_48672/m.136076 type:complete len:248 (-) Transcript_48672:246-989(-)